MKIEESTTVRLTDASGNNVYTIDIKCVQKKRINNYQSNG